MLALIPKTAKVLFLDLLPLYGIMWLSGFFACVHLPDTVQAVLLQLEEYHMISAICLPCYTESAPFRGITKGGQKFNRYMKGGAVFTSYPKGERPSDIERPSTQDLDEAMTSFASWELCLKT